MTNKFKNFLYNNKSCIIYCFILFIILLLLVIPKLMHQYSVGVANWDTFLYLENGRNFAKMGWGDVPSIAPVLPMMLAKLFLLAGHTYVEAIFNIDVVFYIIGVIVFFLILRFKFDNNTSFIGSLIYATFTLLYSWVAVGGNDIIGVTGTLITIYFIILACNYNSKFFYPAFFFAAYAFLSRYTAGIMIFAIITYLIMKKPNLKQLRDMIIGIIIGVVGILWFLDEFNKKLNTPFPFMGQFSGTVSNTKVIDAGFLPDSWYYITHIPNYLSSSIPPGCGFNAVINPMGNIPTILSDIYIIFMIVGFILIFYNIYRKVKSSDIKFLTRENSISIITTIIVFIACILTISKVSYITTNMLFMVVLVELYYTFKKYDIKYLSYDFLMISLFFTYLVFQSVLYTKNDRYFITVLPFIAYFITNAIYYIFKYVNNKISSIKSIKPSVIITAVVVIFLVFNSLSFAASIPDKSDYDDIKDACDWFKENYPDYNNKTLTYSDNWPAVSWYLNIYAQRGVLEADDNATDQLAYMMLADNKTHNAAHFYIDTKNNHKNNYTGFIEVYRTGGVTIYQNTYLQSHDYKDLRSDEYDRYYYDLFNKTRMDV